MSPSRPNRSRGADPALIEARRAHLPTITFPDDLPVSGCRDEITQALLDHQVVVVAGETGSGKTTQLPKICLAAGRGINGMIGHTQPRRIAATSVAQRIADETGTELGEAVGYCVRFSDRVSPSTLVKVMTDGILLREIASDPMLRAYDTLIIDEAHERSLNIDFILGFLKRLLPRRPDLKVIITSATIEPERFARHFATATDTVPIIEVSGRTYPVELRYRPPETGTEQTAAIDAAVSELWSGASGDILVFLPTERDIRDTAKALAHREGSGAEIVPLYARLSIGEQRRVFTPSNGRRIVLATNVAETSLTVPGIRYVVDTGTARISRYSPRTKVTRLPIEPVSQASARQRAGRCGRVAAGICIRLYDEADFDTRDPYTDPEILRANLAGVILSMVSLRLGDIAEFGFVSPPSPRAIADGLAELGELGAIVARPDGPPKLTAVGKSLARLPIDPRPARMLVTAHELGCTADVLVVAAALSIPDVRLRPADKREAADEAHRRFDEPGSDFLALLNLWDYAEEMRAELSGNQFRRRCEREFLHWTRLREWRDLHRQLQRTVKDLGWSAKRSGERDADAVHQAILSGLLSNIAARKSDSKEYLGARNTSLMIFPSSPLAKKPPAFLMAAELIETTRTYASTVARIDPAWAERLAGDLCKRSYSEPHWSSRRGATMAYERVTLFGVTLAASRRVTYTAIDPQLCREMFLRHALVDGDWQSKHAFFARNRALLDDAAEVESRARRRDLVISADQLFGFYDARVPTTVVSARHFDSWWKGESTSNPELLDLRAEDVVASSGVSDTDYPGWWAQGELRLALRYKFAPGDPDDGVTVEIPRDLVDHVRPVGFDWSVPGMREDLAVALIKTLPKQTRKLTSPAARFAQAALARLTPRSEPLLSGLARELSALTRTSIFPDSFDLDRVEDHLKMNFAVVDDRGTILASSRSLARLQRPDRPSTPTRDAPAPIQSSTWTTDTFGDLRDSVAAQIAGQQVTRFPGLAVVDEKTVETRLFATAAARDAALHSSTLVLLAAQIPPLGRTIVAGLSPAQRLALSQQPYESLEALLADCTRRAIRDTVGPRDTAALRSPAGFAALREQFAPRIAEQAPMVFAAALAVFAHLPDVHAAVDARTGTLAADDVAEQLSDLVFDGFIGATPMAHLVEIPRYLDAAAHRLEVLETAADRDREATAAIDRVVERWNQRIQQLPETRREAFNEYAHWMVEELRVGLYAQRLRTAYPVSEKRVVRAFDTFT
ncbi:MAG TPA: ATP-dependent RNA helicase HrpA [Gordonia sp. (in: high G+C Gram-positive bacteria)]|uniref:ATP-dependent RNA helicase HrpA n=1 Tax=unclassified Gordonia (in: high G+C Gram-positive bacteria) TaxID=2657482 RepID=UPI000FAD6228|nr:MULTISPECIES: ATP-dependent RNA helicase HrpA [unclassified Gordonia (in: high G+C Gram-positive bacteria)]RUP37519.1 MAG: ATP-dependent RNA helicase HrpA [Gordonia sp. (in: high G+C Gram-positive bacteria)]HNP56081.1 ATP-dependent RNA helicase HrpA [Gordonia sp. (in: high G+C Gram-positive bacteria)]HRC51391.1 ATP-dependent RNA helicase HrpA [Gordonia sp. (in: high G+C Gram-positive bacteria)]